MRIASLAPSVTEILYELDRESDIVCSTHFCDYPEAARRLPKVGSWIRIDLKKLKSFSPDLIFTSSAVQGTLTSELKALGYRVININPMRLHEVVESYNQIGQMVDRVESAEKISSNLYKTIMSYHLQPLTIRPPRVYCEEWSAPPMVAGNWVPDIVELAGGVAVLSEAGKLSREFALADLVKSDPEIIILHICGLSTRVDPRSITRRPGWEKMTAVRNKHIFVLDDSLLNRPTSRLISGLRMLKDIFSEWRPAHDTEQYKVLPVWQEGSGT
ncbi:MAG: hypothetical protein A2722_00530 [Candidatus Doudnabacteria bacterium RIFCSPHIGHO2_01_FULL_50_11]|uniref:Fe/B12 periplasmic-binding domain-containing protein n=1 Tax=Candidatus Doudnabacteria bacterium RIFCSPHIGHO2_01_FULL_50_11 TaxID=1817828 RepID=A0A1F5PHB4_9BACT|nr:MAG: hypothetical protein A2722_00530 [Candidatus Doudnabacteria bacterium RIFCSPHIGHO2_01_FULL_50_11]HLC44348.1 cobalamin-binding protein [Patescibacteria group bacterium]